MTLRPSCRRPSSMKHATLHTFIPAQATMILLFKRHWRSQAFVEFADEQSCAAGKAAIHGRLFAGETVRATFVTPEYFGQLG